MGSCCVSSRELQIKFTTKISVFAHYLQTSPYRRFPKRNKYIIWETFKVLEVQTLSMRSTKMTHSEHARAG